MTDEAERKAFFKVMQQVHADKALRATFVAEARRLAADPMSRAKRAEALKDKSVPPSAFASRCFTTEIE